MAAGESTVGKPIKCKAAVAREASKPLVIEDIEVAPPKAGEVRVKILYTGVCHTDAYTLGGLDPEGLFPVVLGHEGGGVIESVGEGVDASLVGKKCVPLYIPECRLPECRYCSGTKSNLCSTIRSTQGRGVMPDGSSRLTDAEGKSLFHFMGTSTFSQYTVLPEMSVAILPDSAPLDKACLFGCGITTGYGAATKSCPVEVGSTVAVFGLGAVGLAVILGAKAQGAARIIAVDINPAKFELARSLGATDCLNPKDHDKPTQTVLQEMTDGGVDFSFECIGNTGTMRAALEACHKGWGKSCIIGVAAAGQEISTRPFQLVTGRTWCGSAFGGVKGRSELPGIIDESVKGEGTIRAETFITHKWPLGQINEAFHVLHEGEAIRSVVDLQDLATEGGGPVAAEEGKGE